MRLVGGGPFCTLGRLSGVITYALLAASSVNAFSFPIVGRPRSDARYLKKRTDIGAYGNGSTIVENSGDTVYSCNITLGGKEFEVLIDTGRYGLV